MEYMWLIEVAVMLLHATEHNLDEKQRTQIIVMEKDTNNTEQKNNEQKGVVRRRSSQEPGMRLQRCVSTSLVTPLPYTHTGRANTN